MYDSIFHEITIEQLRKTRDIEIAMDDISRIIYKETGRNFTTEQMEVLCTTGVYRVFRIRVTSNCASVYKTLGFAIIKYNRGIKVSLIMNYPSLLGLWLPVKDTINRIKANIRDMISKPCEIKLTLSDNNAVEEQNNKKRTGFNY